MDNEIVMPILVQPVSRPKFWASAIIAGLVVIFFVFDGVAKVIQAEPVVKASEQLGLPASATPKIGILLLVCTLIYVIPKTSILGAILLTGYLGGAIAIHVRAENGIFPVAFASVFGGLVWFALALREPRLMRLILMREW